MIYKQGGFVMKKSKKILCMILTMNMISSSAVFAEELNKVEIDEITQDEVHQEIVNEEWLSEFDFRQQAQEVIETTDEIFSTNIVPEWAISSPMRINQEPVRSGNIQDGSSFENAAPIGVNKYVERPVLPGADAVYYRYDTELRAEIDDQSDWTVNASGNGMDENKVNAFIWTDPSAYINNESNSYVYPNNVMRICDKVNGHASDANIEAIRSFTEQSGNVSVSFSYMHGAMSKKTRVELRDNTDVLGYIFVNPSVNCGLTYCASNGTQTTLSWGTQNDDGIYLKKNTWYNLRFELNFNTHSVSVYLNNQLKANGLLPTDSDGINNLRFATNNDSEALIYVDAINITGNTSVVSDTFENILIGVDGWHYIDEYPDITVYDSNYNVISPVSSQYLLENGTYYIRVPDMYLITLRSDGVSSNNPIRMQPPAYISGLTAEIPITELTDGFVCGSYTVENHTGTEQESMVIAGLYTKNDNTLVQVSVMRKTIAGGESETFTTGFNVPLDYENYRIRVMLWDNAEDRTLIGNPIILQ